MPEPLATGVQGPNAAPIAPAEARYIKLGAGGAAAQACFGANQLALGFADIPHEQCLRGDWDGVRGRFIAEGKSPQKASDHTRELRDFYTLGADTLWITFAEGALWWAFAEPAVEWSGSGSALPRVRRTRGVWRNTNIAGRPLITRELSTRLTSVAGYRATICGVGETDYLVRRINALPEPLIEQAEAARAALHQVAVDLIRQLHDKEFELLVDLIFANAGWRRVSVLGETQADIDLLVEQPATGERAFVQVKSRATPATLNDYVERFRAYGDCERMFFVCHSPTRALAELGDGPEQVDLWFAPTLAHKAVRAGLLDWLIERVR